MCVCGAGYLKEVVVVKERSVVLQLSLLGLLYLILPLLLQFCNTLKETHEIIKLQLFVSVQVGSLIYFFNLNSGLLFSLILFLICF